MMPISHEEVLEEMHKLRLRVFEEKEQGKDKQHVKLNISKKEKDEILSKYYNAKR